MSTSVGDVMGLARGNQGIVLVSREIMLGNDGERHAGGYSGTDSASWIVLNLILVMPSSKQL